jgi:hypothetical protein
MFFPPRRHTLPDLESTIGLRFQKFAAAQPLLQMSQFFAGTEMKGSTFMRKKIKIFGD